MLSTFNVNDGFNHESLRIKIDTSPPLQRGTRILDELIKHAAHLSGCAVRLSDHGYVELLHIQLGKPTQNACIERFHCTLDHYVFTTPAEVRRMTEDWRHRYSHDRPHRALRGLSPIRYAIASSSTLMWFAERSPVETNGDGLA